MSNLKTTVLIVCVLFSSLVFTQDNTIYNALSVPTELKTKANAVVRLNQKEITIHTQQRMTETLTRVVTILNEKGLEFTNTIVRFDKYRKVKKIEAIVYDADGKEIKKIKKKDFIDQSAVDGGTLYSDSRVLYMAYQPVSYPITIAFSYQIEDKNTAAIRDWNPIDGYSVAIEKDIYTLVDEAGIKLITKHKKFEDYNVVHSKNGNAISYEVKNVKALKPESLAPTLDKLTPRAMITAEKFHYYGVDGEASSWKDFGNWMYNALLEGRQVLDPQTKYEILKLVEDVEDPIEKAKLIYKYVQENTRYISVQVGIGGVQPISASEVDRVKYGDCKGLTNYTQALLSEVGVESYYTVVEAGNQIVDFEEDFYSLAQGNHIILAIPNNEKMIWLDCTSQKHPFGFVGDFTDNRNVLIVQKDHSKIIKTVAYVDTDNHMFTKADIELSEEGHLKANAQITSKGINYDRRFILQDYSKKDLKDIYKNYWDYIDNLSVDDYSFINDKDIVTFKENLKLTAFDYAIIKDGKLIFSPNIFDKDLFVPKRYRNRKFPFEIQRGFESKSEFRISIPEKYTLNEIPQDINITNIFGHYKVSYILKGNILIYKRDYFIKKGKYDSSQYDLFRKFKREVTKQDKSNLIFNK